MRALSDPRRSVPANLIVRDYDFLCPFAQNSSERLCVSERERGRYKKNERKRERKKKEGGSKIESEIAAKDVKERSDRRESAANGKGEIHRGRVRAGPEYRETAIATVAVGEYVISRRVFNQA